MPVAAICGCGQWPVRGNPDYVYTCVVRREFVTGAYQSGFDKGVSMFYYYREARSNHFV